MSRLLALVLLLAAAPSAAQQAPTCPPLAGLCSRLAAQPVLLDSPDGLVPNPARTGETWTALREAGATGPDAAAFDSRVRPLFEAMRAQALSRLAAAGDDEPARRLRRYFERLPLRAIHWPRCDRQADPIAASAGQDGTPDVRVCPWMSRVDPSALAFMLGHELGHHLDPCWHERLDRRALEALDRLDPARADSCSRRPAEPEAVQAFVEGYADRVGAELLAGAAAAGGLNPPSGASFDVRAAALLQHALQPGCGRYGFGRVDAFLAEPALRAALGCGL